MTIPFSVLDAWPDACAARWEEALNLYLDGELPRGEEAPLFGHLATCESCRRSLGTLLEFRRMSRQEVLHVPVAVDDAFFKRLDQVRRRHAVADRSVQRRPLWQLRPRVSVRVATVAAAFLFLAGVLLPRDLGQAPLLPAVEGLQERVEFRRTLPALRGEAVYVFYPGLTVEAARIIEEQATPDPL